MHALPGMLPSSDMCPVPGPECQQALGIYVGAWALVIVTLLVAVHFAARRRTQLRQRFGIAGTVANRLPNALAIVSLVANAHVL